MKRLCDLTGLSNTTVKLSELISSFFRAFDLSCFRDRSYKLLHGNFPR